MWINPRDPRHLIIGNDGGVSISHDRSQTWAWMPNLLGAQAYHVEFDMQTPYHVCAGLQDNNTWCGPSAVRTNSGIHNDNWYVISGGDGFQPLMDPTDSRIVYAESQDGRMSRTDRLTNERTAVRPEPAEQKPGDTSGTTTRRRYASNCADCTTTTKGMVSACRPGLRWTSNCAIYNDEYSSAIEPCASLNAFQPAHAASETRCCSSLAWRCCSR
jgi:hypothetical protein